MAEQVQQLDVVQRLYTEVGLDPVRMTWLAFFPPAGARSSGGFP
jgi:hypothetical protein